MMPLWMWEAGYLLCGVAFALWYWWRIARSKALARYVKAQVDSLPSWLPAPRMWTAIAFIVGWPIPVIQYTIGGQAFGGEPPDEKDQ